MTYVGNYNGLCGCGCGVRTLISKRSSTRDGYIKGESVFFVGNHHLRGRRSHNWKGGRVVTAKGYVRAQKLGHPRATKDGYVYEHILIAEHALGRYLPDGVVVHHVNEIKHENANSNLVICQDETYHKLLHRRKRMLEKYGRI